MRANSAKAAVRGADRTIGRAVRGLLVTLIVGYQRLVSPLLGPRCRFYPSCSSYAVQAVRVHGAGKGGALAIARVCRCHPWNAGGVDPVPPKGAWKPEPYVSLEDHADLRARLAPGESAHDVDPDHPTHRSAA